MSYHTFSSPFYPAYPHLPLPNSTPLNLTLPSPWLSPPLYPPSPTFPPVPLPYPTISCPTPFHTSILSSILPSPPIPLPFPPLAALPSHPLLSPFTLPYLLHDTPLHNTLPYPPLFPTQSLLSHPLSLNQLCTTPLYPPISSPLSYPTLPDSIPCTISNPALLSSPPLPSLYHSLPSLPSPPILSSPPLPYPTLLHDIPLHHTLPYPPLFPTQSLLSHPLSLNQLCTTPLYPPIPSPLSYPTLPDSIPCTISNPALLSSPSLYPSLLFPTIPSTPRLRPKRLVKKHVGPKGLGAETSRAETAWCRNV